jgi:hypothetical protein
MFLGLDTRHQWRFEAVQKSVYFPNGVKVTHRRYRNDLVFELVKKPKEECFSPIGKAIGLEPEPVISEWCPTPTGANSIPDRQGIEGY